MEDRALRAANTVNDPPFCSLITANYNGKRYLKDCFTALLAMDYPADRLEIIMVDNCSDDDSIAYTQEHFPKVRVVKNEVNDYSKALNLGIRSARGDLIGFINNDTRVDKRWLAELVRLFEPDDRVGCVGGKIL